MLHLNSLLANIAGLKLIFPSSEASAGMKATLFPRCLSQYRFAFFPVELLPQVEMFSSLQTMLTKTFFPQSCGKAI